MMTKQEKEDLLVIFRNYLFALQVRNEYGDIYGDTEDIIDYYESILTEAHVLQLKRTKER